MASAAERIKLSRNGGAGTTAGTTASSAPQALHLNPQHNFQRGAHLSNPSSFQWGVNVVQRETGEVSPAARAIPLPARICVSGPDEAKEPELPSFEERTGELLEAMKVKRLAENVAEAIEQSSNH